MSREKYLVLENGRVFRGRSFGFDGAAVAEVVFTTGMTGYLETLTDKSYYGQIIVQTFPLIGNYGVIPADFEGDNPVPSGYIVKNWCQRPSNFRSEGCLDAFLKRRKITGLCDVDTRSLTKAIREHGVMNGAIVDDPSLADMDAIRAYRVERAVESTTAKEPRTVGEGREVALLDFGLKENITRELIRRGCRVTVWPGDTPPERILAAGPAGIMLSNGPGDPTENTGIIANLRALLGSGIPIFGICLGHQLLALASGFGTTKLKYGHRGANQPVKELATGRVYITSQNHGYAVVSDTIDKNVAEEAFVNVNDGTNEGIIYRGAPAFSAQFHPEHCGGPMDTEWLFDRFIGMMGN
ncbi:MAG: carbamoyl phosphate synthase small subunit [Clostridiales bacterium]|nr:carbamoyl phosphate synthase small subunit [Clostridiales bacterium]